MSLYNVSSTGSYGPAYAARATDFLPVKFIFLIDRKKKIIKTARERGMVLLELCL